MDVKQPTALTNLQRGNVKQASPTPPSERTVHELAAQGELYKVDPLMVDTVDADNMTPLIWAAGYGQEPTTELLLKSGANPNHKAIGGKTALMVAAAQGFFHVVRMLINYGAHLDDVDDHGNSALIYAAHQDRALILQQLLKSGANLNTTNYYGATAYSTAISQLNKSAQASIESHLLSLLKGLNPSMKHWY